MGAVIQEVAPPEVIGDDGDIFAYILDEFQRTGDSSLLHSIVSVDYSEKPADIISFIEDKRYLGENCRNLHQKWKDELWEIFKPESSVVEWLIGGAIGTGKSTAAGIALCYCVHKVGCLVNPTSFFQLLAGKPIVWGIYNVTLSKAEDIYDRIKFWTANSPWFKERLPRRLRPDDPIYFPKKNLQVDVGSLADHALGDDILGMVMDEANFFKRKVDEATRTRAEDIFASSFIRRLSRFTKAGFSPGLSILISSSKYDSSFLEKRKKLILEQPELASTRRITEFARWDTMMAQDLSPERFRVLVGDDKTPSRILEEEEVAPRGYDIAEVPMDFKEAYLDDVDMALRDLSGVAAVGSRKFFSNRQAISETEKTDRVHPFGSETIMIPLNSGVRIEDFLNMRAIASVKDSRWVPLSHPGGKRFAHVDIGLTGEAMGIAIGHPVQLEAGFWGVFYDILLRVKAPSGSEVDLTSVIHFFKWLRKNLFPIATITYDQFQSRHSLQLLLSEGFDAKKLSVGLDEYLLFKRLVNAGCCNWYRMDILCEELKNLIRDQDDKKRPFHPSGGSDDVADAACAVAVHCTGLLDKGSILDINASRRVQSGNLSSVRIRNINRLLGAFVR